MTLVNNQHATAGRVVLLNGTSSSGKTTLARALRARLPPEFCFYSSDQLADAQFRPVDPAARSAGREKFFDAFHRSIPAMAFAGLDLLVEHIVEEQRWADDLAILLARLDVFWVGVHAPMDVISAREVKRGDRAIGEAAYHLRTHSFCRYSFEVDTTRPTDELAAEIATAWNTRRPQPAG